MRIIRPHDHNDDDPDDRQPKRPGPVDPAQQGQQLADEVEDFLASAVANVPPVDDESPVSAAAKPRPALRLVPDADDSDTAEWDAPLDPAEIAAAGRGARRRMVRGAAGGSTVVVLSGLLATWGESLVVTGPVAVYGAGWLAYLWWNAALRPSAPDVLAAVAAGIGHALTAVALAIVAAVRAGITRTRRETPEPTPVSPSA
ncbi:hypothetical protein [Nocardia xishanensis]|uniref:hypothetical protein n=1 Tax=Nocardia xishanensis TaxID=238964 RepID=UPI00343E8430